MLLIMTTRVSITIRYGNLAVNLTLSSLTLSRQLAVKFDISLILIIIRYLK